MISAASQASTTKANLVMYIVIPLAAVVMIAIVGVLVYLQIKRKLLAENTRNPAVSV